MVTEGVWTWFFCSLLIIILFTVATVKYLRKYFGKQKFTEINKELFVKQVLYDSKSATQVIRSEPIPTAEFPSYYEKRRKYTTVDRLEFKAVIKVIILKVNLQHLIKFYFS